MKITYLKLKNFIAIKTVLNKEILEIDFTKMINSICLFIGPIGSCKTFILSHLQPFATVGNVDLRNGEEMILSGKDGEKEIIFVNNNITYHIHHYYLNKKDSKKIKSFITKNGEELNPSGLITRFSEIIEKEFGIDISFLKIIRLGSNVNNLIRLTDTNRKEFAVKLLKDIDEYLQDYKIAEKKYRECKNQLSGLESKLASYESEEYYKTAEQKLDNKLQNLNDELSKTKEELYKAAGRLESRIGSSIDGLRDKITELNSQKNKLSKELSYVLSELSKIKNIFVNYDMLKYIEELKSKKQSLEIELSSSIAKIEVLSQNIDESKKLLHDLENQLKSLTELDNDVNIKKDLKIAEDFVNQYSKYYKDFNPTCSAADILADISLMQIIKSRIDNIREFSLPSRELFYKAYNKKNPKEYLNKKLKKSSIEYKITEIRSFFKDIVMITPIECNNYSICPYYKAFKGDKKNKENEIDIINGALKVYDLFLDIESLLRNRKDIFPYKVFLTNIATDILYGKMTFFDFQAASKYVLFLQKFDLYKENKKRIIDYKKQLEILDTRKNNIDRSSVTQQKSLLIQISNNEIKLREYKKNKKEIKILIDKINDLIIESEKYYQLNNRKTDIESSIEDTKKKLEKLNLYIYLLNKYDEYYVKTNQYIEKLNKDIKEISDKKFSVKVKLIEYQKLKVIINKLSDKLKKINLVKNAVSPKNGIPLLYLNSKMDRCISVANNIISEICSDIRLEKIILTEKEFRIPYTKNGVVINDIINASQGETSIISMALSFALITEFTDSKYNILLLDEIDGPLDINLKANVLRMIENRMFEMNYEQIFMITHNQLFENYPVDVYETIKEDDQLTSYKNINILK